MTPLVIHIGLPKTATTTLQECLFARHPSINYLGKPYTRGSLGMAIHAIRLMDEIEYRSVAAERMEYVKQALSDRDDAHLVTVLSDEGLSASGGADRTLIARRLFEAFGDARILITVRRQVDALESYYAEYLRRVSAESGLRYYSFPQWIQSCYVKYGRPRRAGMRKQFFYTSAIAVGNPLSELKYYELAEMYSEIFGHGRVRILLLEELREDPRAFYRSIADFLGIDHALLPEDVIRSKRNESPSGVAVLEKRYPALARVKSALPKPLVAAVKSYVPGQKAKLSWPGGLRETIGEIYVDGNRRLASSYGLPLGGYGYPL
jgi:hypothetical protein